MSPPSEGEPRTDPAALQIVPLPDDPAVIETIAAWHQAAWGHLTGRSREERARELARQCGSEAIPLTLMAASAGRPVGAASLLTHDMDTHPEWSPWLASVYVAPTHRRQGIGEQLCRAIVAEAKRLGVPRLFLFTPDKAAFYARQGWREIAREPYRGEDVTVMEQVLP